MLTLAAISLEGPFTDAPGAVQECYRPADAFLEGHDLVLQAEEHSSEALINAIMASKAGHPLWLDVIDLMMERAGSSHNVLYATGAHMLHAC